MDNRVFIPKDKFDMAAVERLALVRPEQISGIERPLLEWIADINWPVAKNSCRPSSTTPTPLPTI